jgi:hypothetical protein
MARPVYLQQRTCLVSAGTVVECHKPTHAVQQNSHLTMPPPNNWECDRGAKVFLSLHFLFQDLTQYQERYWPNTDPNSQPLCVGFLQSRS